MKCIPLDNIDVIIECGENTSCPNHLCELFSNCIHFFQIHGIEMVRFFDIFMKS